jgi:AcrR family transcriptional regulator
VRAALMRRYWFRAGPMTASHPCRLDRGVRAIGGRQSGKMTTMQPAGRRPAHRPSRRGVIVNTAMELLVHTPPELLTVAAIAESADMTSAAVYYHYPSKEAIILSGITAVGQGYLSAVRRAVDEVVQGAGLGTIPAEVTKWAENAPGAYAYFVAAAGLSPAVEAERRRNQIEVIDHLRRAVEELRPDLNAAQVSVRAVALLTVTETGVTSVLTLDRATRGLSPSRLRAEVAALAEHIVAG